MLSQNMQYNYVSLKVKIINYTLYCFFILASYHDFQCVVRPSHDKQLALGELFFLLFFFFDVMIQRRKVLHHVTFVMRRSYNKATCRIFLWCIENHRQKSKLIAPLTEIWLQVRHGTSNYHQLLTAFQADCRLFSRSQYRALQESASRGKNNEMIDIR